MWKNHLKLSKQYPKISLQEERRLIAKAKKGSSKEADELVLRHTSFVIFRINKRVFPSHLQRFGDELFSESIFILYEKIKTYNLRYRDRDGNFKPVRFSSYIWKRVDGFILDFLRKELCEEKGNFEKRVNVSNETEEKMEEG